MSFTAPTSTAPLRVGTYADSASTPTMNIGSNYGGCAGATGSLTISELEFTCAAHGLRNSWRLKKFVATFNQRCEDTHSTLQGSVSYSDPGGLPCIGVTVPPTADPSSPTTPADPSSPPATPSADATVRLPNGDWPAAVVGSSGTALNAIDIATVTSNGYEGDVTLEVVTDAQEGDGFNVSIEPHLIAAPGIGDAKITFDVATAFPKDYHVTVVTSANAKISYSTFIVSIVCDPPMILGVDQPKLTFLNKDVPAEMQVKPIGSAPFDYQWYNAPAGSTRFPVEGATSDTLTTTQEGSYWVRVTNACGSADSNTASVIKQR